VRILSCVSHIVIVQNVMSRSFRSAPVTNPGASLACCRDRSAYTTNAGMKRTDRIRNRVTLTNAIDRTFRNGYFRV
jgi:hypothetical protein